VFFDPLSATGADPDHSHGESRFVPFGVSSCGKERQSMSAKIRYSDEPLGDMKVIPDFLPSPEELGFREEGVKVTIALSKKSVEFFKAEAAKHRTQYQRMIRRLLDAYSDTYSRRLTSRSTRTARKRAAG
jgi:predicted DNA binding CopG/RHH family protein